jgi:hypothetical protein
MATGFKGYLLKFGDTILPMRFLKFNSYSCTPYQRTELEAYRDDYTQNLHRVTSEGLKTKIEANTPPMYLEQKIEFQNYLNYGLEDELQRKYKVTYWNDEVNDYKIGLFYIPDTQFSIYLVRNNSILYNSFKLTLIEY